MRIAKTAAYLWAACLATALGTAQAGEWKVFCIPDKHLDVGWAYLPHDALDQGYPGSVEDFQNFISLRALFMRESSEDAAPEARFRWYFDGAWQLEQFEKFFPNQANQARKLINSGQFSYNPLYAHLHSAYLSNEQLLRSMDVMRDLERRGYRRSETAVHADVPTITWGYASALASGGVKYLFKPTWFDSPYNRSLENVAPAPLFRWAGPDGQSVLLFYHWGYESMPPPCWFGAPCDLTAEKMVLNAVKHYEGLAAKGLYPYDAFPMFGSEGDWGVPDLRGVKAIECWNKSHTDVKLQMATPDDFFAYMEKNFADKIPGVVSGGWGVSYDVVEGNAAKTGARNRANDRLLLMAESFGAVANQRFGTPYPSVPLAEAWRKQDLYHEHSFGIRDGTGPEGRRQYAWKNRLTEQAEAIGHDTLDPALAAIVEQIDGGAAGRWAVFNSLSWPVTDVVEIELPPTGKLASSATPHALPAPKKLRLRLDNVPALGYACIDLAAAAKAAEQAPAGAVVGVAADGQAGAAAAPVAADAAKRTLENEFYRLTLAADGSIASLLDKPSGRELFDAAAPYRGNQFIFKDDAWQDHSPTQAKIEVIDYGPAGAALEVRAEPTSIFPGISTRYTLTPGIKRLDIKNRFTKEPGTTATNETVFYAFPFAVPQGKFYLDTPGVVSRYPQDFRPETDWTIMPAQSFAAVGNEDLTAVLATREGPNFEFSAMRKFFDHPKQPDLSTTTIFAQPLTKQSVNRDDYDLEGGTYEFNYAITSRAGAFDPAAAVRFAASFQRGLTPVAATAGNGGALPAAKSFATLDSDAVVLSALKKSDDAPGMMARLWRVGGGVNEAPIDVRLKLADVDRCTAVLTDSLGRDLPAGAAAALKTEPDGSVVVPCRPRQFVTLRIVPQ